LFFQGKVGMNLKKYIPDGKYFQLVANARQVMAARVILEAAEIKRDEIRTSKEKNPKICPEDLRKDIVFLTGFVAGLNWAIDLPEEAHKIIAKLPDN
jgi:hypothetical protein